MDLKRSWNKFNYFSLYVIVTNNAMLENRFTSITNDFNLRRTHFIPKSLGLV